jgi:hypothetical protein
MGPELATMTNPPPDQPQEPDPPDLDLLLHVVRLLLSDLADHLRGRDHPDDVDLRVRSLAVRAVVIRAIQNRRAET